MTLPAGNHCYKSQLGKTKGLTFKFFYLAQLILIYSPDAGGAMHHMYQTVEKSPKTRRITVPELASAWVLASSNKVTECMKVTKRV